MLVGGVSVLITVTCMIAVTWPAIEAWQLDAHRVGAALRRAVVFDAVLGSFLTWGLWHITALTLTRVDSEGITAPRLFGPSVFIRWQDVIRISGGPRSCKVSSRDSHIRLSSLHLGGDRLEPTLRRLAPPEAFRGTPRPETSSN
jgi:hypothetical protein